MFSNISSARIHLISISNIKFENHPYVLIIGLMLYQHNRIDRICKVVPLYGPASYDSSEVDSNVFHNHIDRI